MAQLIRIGDNRNGYRTLVDYVRCHGRKQDSRNGPTLEVDDMVIELADPTKAIPCGIGRRGYSMALALLEGLQLVAGQTYDDLMIKIAPSTEQFREDDGQFHGGYGRRISKQMIPVINRLKTDNDSRQAVVTIWNPDLDAEGGKRDHPCNCLLNWRVRDGRLLMSTYCRSNDIHWGWPYDVVMMTVLQLTIANYLGVAAGPYVHHAASFHAYTRDLPTLKTLQPFNGVDMRLHGLNVSDCGSWEAVQKRADELVIDAATSNQSDRWIGSDQWYYTVLSEKLSQ